MGGDAPIEASSAPLPVAPSQAAKPPAAKPQARTAAPRPPEPGGVWEAFLEALRPRSMRLWGTLHSTEFAGPDADGALRVKAGSGAGLLAQVLRDPETQTLFREILGSLGVKTPEVRIEGASKPAAAKAVEKATAPKPAEKPAAAKATPKAASAAPQKAAPKPAPETKETKEAAPAAEEPPAPAEKPAPPPAAKDTRSMGQLFNDEPMLQKALDMFDGEVLP